PDPAGDDVRARRRSGCPQPFDEILRWFVAVLQPQDEVAVAFGSRWSRWFTLHDLRPARVSVVRVEGETSGAQRPRQSVSQPSRDAVGARLEQHRASIAGRNEFARSPGVARDERDPALEALV